MIAIVLTPALIVFLCPDEPAQAVDEYVTPNIIVVMADDQGWGDVRYNGHAVLHTPNLDAMAENGLRFDRFYANASMCSPTRAGTLTGRNNLRSGIGGPIAHGRGHMPADEITLAEALRPAGYVSGHFGKWHLGDIHNNENQKHLLHPGHAGFDHWFSTQNVLPTFNPYQGKFDENHHYYRNGKYVPETDAMKGDDSRIVMDGALEFIRSQAKARKPFFAFICFHAMHNPLVMVPQYQEHYPDVTDRKQLVYYTNVTAIDTAVGRLRTEMRRLKIADNTMLWFTSDNGPLHKQGTGIGSKGPYRGSKGMLYEGGIRVPGLLEWPHVIKQARTVKYMAVTTDIFPTSLDVVGLKLPDRPYDGTSLRPVIEGKKLKRQGGVGFGAKGWRAWQTERFKLLRVKGKESKWELYDLWDDPYEKNNLASDRPNLVASLAHEIDAWSQSCKSSQDGKDYGAP
ncbi:MAG: sulfatase-like hydrolase/transferase [Pirellulaceae bacterium]|jgi:arylsulfatase A-like enzyme|nr:sulfatase-like hydrolase/transferase [Pirellulaceae bacterium]MDP7020250.1 sulfatase-like hydrolase/transferase [Pirellulaceae bacterium]